MLKEHTLVGFFTSEDEAARSFRVSARHFPKWRVGQIIRMPSSPGLLSFALIINRQRDTDTGLLLDNLGVSQTLRADDVKGMEEPCF
jgi:hypothetical protein